jgi:quinol monooxygenase YgiN
MRESMMKKIVLARIYIKNRSAEDFKKHAAVIIKKTRTEKGCLFYSLYQDITRPNEFIFYEEYADQNALDIHFNSEYLKTFRAGIGNMMSKESVVEVI